MKHYQSQEFYENLAKDYIQIKNTIECTESRCSKIKLERELEEILKHLEVLIYYRSNKYKKFPNFPDLHQEGFRGLIMALNTYRPSKSAFTWWADKYISIRISRAANAHSIIRVPIAKAKLQKPMRSSTIPIIFYGDAESDFIKEENKMLLDNAMGSLSDLQNNLISDFYKMDGDKGNKEKIAEQYNLSVKELNTELKLARRTIKNNLVQFGQ